MTWAFFSRRALRETRRHLAVAIGIVLATFLLVFLCGVAIYAARAADGLVPLLQRNVHLIAYLGEDVDEARARAMTDVLRRLPGVDRVRLVDSAEALRRLRDDAVAIGAGAALAKIEEGFLPRSIEIGLVPDSDLAIRAHNLAERLTGLAGVAAVDAMTDGVLRLTAWLAVLRWLGRLAIALALLGGGLAIALALARGRRARHDEARTLHLLGETAAGVRLPGGLAGAACGVLGGALAAGALALLARVAPGLFFADVGALIEAALPTLRAALPIWAGALGAALGLGSLVGYLATPLPRDVEI